MRHLNRLSISLKLPAIIVALSLTTGGVTAGLSYFGARTPLEAEAKNKLGAVLDSRTEVVQAWLGSIIDDAEMLSVNPTVRSAINEFADAWRSLPGDPTKYLQDQYIRRNPHPTGSKELLDSANDGTQYSSAHRTYHPYLRSFLRNRGFYDLFLFDLNGNLVYSVFKEMDYATNFKSGPWADSDLGEAFRAAKASKEPDQEFFFDMKPYGPSKGAPASFISKKVYDHRGAPIGVLAIQVPTDRLNDLLDNTLGLGETGDVYVVGADLLMRSGSRFNDVSSVLKKRIDTPQANAAVDGDTGVMVSQNADGAAVVAAYKSVEILGVHWAIIAEQRSRELFAPIAELQNRLIAQLLISSVAIVVIGVFFARGISSPLALVTRSIQKVGEGDYRSRVPAADRDDEIGKIAKTVVKFKNDLQASIEERRRIEEDRERNYESKLKAIDRAQAVIEFEVDGKIVSANQNFLEITGYSLAEIEGRHHSVFVDSSEAKSSDYRAFWRKLERGEHCSGKFTRRAKDGSTIWLQASYNPILDREGNTIKVISYATDITKGEALAQEALFKSSAFEGSSVAMMLIDRDFIVRYVNDATMQLLIEHEELFQSHWPGFIPERIVGSCIELFDMNSAERREALSNPARLPFTTDIAIGDMRVQLNVGGVFDENGDYVGNVLQWADVTTDRLNAGKLSALDRAQGMIEFSLEGDILYANENFLEMFGYSLEEIKGKRHSLFVPPNVAKSPEYRDLWSKLRNGEYQAGEFERVAKNGKNIWIQSACNPILDGAGKPFKIVEFASNITEDVLERERNAEDRRRQAESLAFVLNSLAEGLRALSEGRNVTVDVEFASEYEQLRADFNSAVTKLAKIDEERRDQETAQSLVVETLAESLNRLSIGDLVTRLEAEYAPEYEKLRLDFNAATEKLEEAVKAVVVNTDGIRNGAGEISQAADDLSNRTRNQAETLRQTAVSLDQLTANVKSAADNAEEANSVVGAAKTNAEVGGNVVRDAVVAMSEIEKSSEQISQIIGVIDHIAFQTNLLALNAGVEAARAGDAGRGFAVVASEVRALAQRSSEAAKEIKSLISNSSQQVERGVDLVGQTGDVLQQLVDAVGNINTLVAEISSSARDLSSGISEINVAVTQMDQVTEQNAAMVEESTAASHSLLQEAEELMRLVSRFTISSEDEELSPAPEVMEEAEMNVVAAAS